MKDALAVLGAALTLVRWGCTVFGVILLVLAVFALFGAGHLTIDYSRTSAVADYSTYYRAKGDSERAAASLEKAKEACLSGPAKQECEK